MHHARTLAALALPMLLVGCAGSAARTPPAVTPIASATASRVTIDLVDYAFQPDAVSVPAGRTTFVLDNRGEQEHEFEILDGDSVVDEVEGLVPGLTRDLTVDLEPGSYTIVCRLADHEARGMKGTLTVTGG